MDPAEVPAALAAARRSACAADSLMVMVDDRDRATALDAALRENGSFADSEDAPATDAVAAELATRRRELPMAEYQLGVLDGNPVAVLAHYPGADDLVFILGPVLRTGTAGSSSPCSPAGRPRPPADVR